MSKSKCCDAEITYRPSPPYNWPWPHCTSCGKSCEVEERFVPHSESCTESPLRECNDNCPHKLAAIPKKKPSEDGNKQIAERMVRLAAFLKEAQDHGFTGDQALFLTRLIVNLDEQAR